MYVTVDGNVGLVEQGQLSHGKGEGVEGSPGA